MADEPAKIYPPNPYPYSLLNMYLRAPETLSTEEGQEMSRLAAADEIAQAQVAEIIAALSDEDLGAVLDTCRRLTRHVRVELRRRAWAREDAPAEAGEGTP